MRTIVLFSTALGAAAMSALTFACGSLDGHTSTGSTLAALSGTLKVPEGVTISSSADVRIALIWATSVSSGDGGPTEFSVAQDIPVKPVFPSGFVLDLTSPPPAGAVTTQYGMEEECGGGSEDDAAPPPCSTGVVKSDPYQAAYGVVVAYEDDNHNGKLDLVPEGSSGYVDTILATNEHEIVTYFVSGTEYFGSGPNHPPLGYGVAIDPAECEDTNVQSDGGLCPQGGYPMVFESASHATYDLNASSSPTISSLMCASSQTQSPSNFDSPGTFWDVATQGAPPGGYPTPGTSGLYCQSVQADCSSSGGADASAPNCTDGHDTSGYYLSNCVAKQQQKGLCEFQETCSSITVGLNGAPKPMGWPCP